MKKLYIGFILLFGFLAFAPQVALGDSLPMLSLEKINQMREQQEKELNCFNKNKLFTGYGHNLKLEEIKGFQESRYATIIGSGKQALTGSPHTNNKYFLYREGRWPRNILITQYKEGEWEYNIIETPSVVVNCKEYIFVKYKSYKEISKGPHKIHIGETPLGINVSSVQPGSLLKYIPEREEVQVLSPLSENDIIKDEWGHVGFTTKEAAEILDENTEDFQDQLEYDTIPDFVIRGMLIALLLTLVIEGILAIPFGWKFVGLVSLANIITNPALNGIIWHYQITETSTILLLEAAVVLIEWGIFSVFIRKNYGKLLLFAFIANLVSYLTGVFFPL
ncbi:MAG: hypothetical protein J5594_04610 [Elusimicrobiaceae bacterium]|nr:hypothetical protein [Elusimicrobiaceae bacterium]